MPRRHAILVVDDEPDVVQSVKDLLRLDYDVFGATRAVDGLKILQERKIDVVMSDQRMPEMTGVEFLTRVRDPHPDATRLLFTGYADIHAVIEAINQGNVYRYITKPWDPDELQTVIREACERHDLIVNRKELLAELEAKNAALESANNELREANDLKAAFIQVASHELRTPLAIALGFAQLAARQTDVREPLRDWIDRANRALKRLKQLVEQITTMLDAGQFEQRMNRQDVDPANIVREAIDDVRPFIELRRQTVVENIPQQLGLMSLDAEKIRDAINHVVLNAIKFTPDEGTLTISAEPAPAGGVLISVGDTGCGIDPAHLPRIGEAFFTGFDVTHHASGQFEHGRQGLGLGLSVVKAFVSMHDGNVKIHSEHGSGTTVTILLPAQKAPQPSAETSSPVGAT